MITLFRESNRSPDELVLQTWRLTQMQRFYKSKRAAEFGAVRKAVACDYLEDTMSKFLRGCGQCTRVHKGKRKKH